MAGKERMFQGRRLRASRAMAPGISADKGSLDIENPPYATFELLVMSKCGPTSSQARASSKINQQPNDEVQHANPTQQSRDDDATRVSETREATA